MKNDTTRFSPLEQDSLIILIYEEEKFVEFECRLTWFSRAVYLYIYRFLRENVTKEKKQIHFFYYIRWWLRIWLYTYSWVEMHWLIIHPSEVYDAVKADDNLWSSFGFYYFLQWEKAHCSSANGQPSGWNASKKQGLLFNMTLADCFRVIVFEWGLTRVMSFVCGL